MAGGPQRGCRAPSIRRQPRRRSAGIGDRAMKRGGVLYASMIGCVGAAVAAAIVMAGPSGRRPGGATDGGGADATTATFVNWETGQIHPVDLTPDGSKLLV